MPWTLAAFALVLVLLAAPAPASAAGKRAGCAVKRAHTVVVTRLVWVYSVRPRGHRRLYACLRATGRRILVAAEYDDEYVSSGAYRDVQVAGRHVALVYEATDISCKAACPPEYDPTRTSIVIRDVRTRARRMALGDVRPRTLRLSAAGVAAWLAPAADGVELRVYDGAGRRALDSGAIEASSMFLTGLRLTWASAAGPRSAELVPF